MTSLVLPLHGHSGIGRVDIRRRFPSAALNLLPPLRRPASPNRPATAIAFLASARRPPAPAPA